MSWYDWFKASASTVHCGTCGNMQQPGMPCGYCAAQRQIGIQPPPPSWLYNTTTTTTTPGTFTTIPVQQGFTGRCPLCDTRPNVNDLIQHIFNHKRLKAQITLSIMAGDIDLKGWQNLLGVIGLENVMGVEEPK